MGNEIIGDKNMCAWADLRWSGHEEQHVQKTSVAFRGEWFSLGEKLWRGSGNFWYVVAFLSDDEPLLRQAVHNGDCTHYLYDRLITLAQTGELLRLDDDGGYAITLDEETK